MSIHHYVRSLPDIKRLATLAKSIKGPACVDLQKYREANQVGVIWSGTDSQGLHFQGEVHFILCSSRAYAEHMRKRQAQDPGARLTHQIARPSEARKVTFMAELAEPILAADYTY